MPPAPDEKPAADAATPDEPGSVRRTRTRVTAGLAFGIGSAAIVASLLYARSRKDR